MKKTFAMTFFLITIGTSALLTGCAPEVGTEAWCKQISEKPKGDLTANEAADFAKHCLFK